MPEVLHGLTAFVENAADFAEASVEVTARYDAERAVRSRCATTVPASRPR